MCLDFGSNTIENNHDITCNDKIEIHMDYLFSACACCGDEFISLDTPKGNRSMRKDHLKMKELIPKDHRKSDKD